MTSQDLLDIAACWDAVVASCAKRLSSLFLMQQHPPPLKPLTTQLLIKRSPFAQESVRAAAATLARTLRGLSLRLADRAQTPPGEALAAVSCTLPLLLDRGIPSSVKEVQGLALDTLAKMVKLARPETVLPHLPQLPGVLLESLSGMGVGIFEAFASGVVLAMGGAEGCWSVVLDEKTCRAL